jgi:hypothetical protein
MIRKRAVFTHNVNIRYRVVSADCNHGYLLTVVTYATKHDKNIVYD